MRFTITPAELLAELGWANKKRGNWLTMKKCPFCGGGEGGDAFTFAVHGTDGNFFCHRSKCGMRGSFWGLLETVGRNPREYFEKDGTKAKTKKKFIYR